MYVGRAPRTFLGDFNQPSPERDRSRSPGDAVQVNPPVQLTQIPSGPAGMAATLRIMRDYARASVRNPDQIIRTKVRDLLGSLPPRQWFPEIRALHAFVRDQIRYLRDPVDLELVQTPEKTLEFAQGDCDDKAALLAALLTAAGHPARFVAIGFGNAGFSHVLVETQISGDRWIPLETIIPVEPGWFPEHVARAYRLKV